MSGVNLRPLLPAPREPGNAADNTAESASGRRQNSGACDRCRSQKSRCDRTWPKCSLCTKRQVHCFYSSDVKKQSLEVHKRQGELLHMMRTAPEDEALDILFRLRASADPQAVLESSRGSVSRQYQPSGIQTARAVSPQSFSALEFELSMRHALPYPPITPVDSSSIDLQPLASMDSSSSSSPLTYGLSQQQQLLPRPDLHDLCDERLRQLDISYWTTVPLPSGVAARIISTYLQTNHPIWGLFHADLFIRDLVGRRLDFCSSFLVNALLCYACQSYGVTDPTMPELSIPFAQATEAMWRAERNTDSALNVAAILMFSLCCHTTDCGVTVAELLVDGRRLAERLRLFGAPESASLYTSFEALNDEWRRSTAHIAWGAYGWMTVNLYYTPAMTPIDHKPVLPVPAANHLPAYYGNTFAALCEFWVIMQEVGALRPRSSTDTGIPLAVAEAKFRKLLSWADSLGEDMAATSTCRDPVIVFHMFFHCAILDLFLPFCSDGPPRLLRSFASRDCSPEALCRASTNQLKRLLVECRLHRHRVLTNLCTAALIQVSNAMLRDASRILRFHTRMAASRRARPKPRAQGPVDGLAVDPEWRFYFLLCVANCQDMLMCYNLAAPLLRGLLAMALRQGVISVVEAKALMVSLEARATAYAAKALRQDFGEVLLDLDLALKGAEDSQIGKICSKFEELVAFDDFTINQDFDGVTEKGGGVDGVDGVDGSRTPRAGES